MHGCGRMNWHYSNQGKQMGPVGSDELRSMIAAGMVLPTDLAWREGMTDWLPVSKIAELQGNSLAGRQYTTSYQTPGVMPPQAAAKTSGMAIASLICGCVGVLGFACFFPFIAGLVGIVLGHLSLSQIRRSQGLVGGKGLAIGGLVTGYLSLVMLLGMIALMFVRVSTPTSILPLESIPDEVELRHESSGPPESVGDDEVNDSATDSGDAR